MGGFFLSHSIRPFLTFWDRTKELSLDITVRLLWAKNFNITKGGTTQQLDVNFRDPRHCSKLGGFYMTLTLYSMFWDETKKLSLRHHRSTFMDKEI